jgi:hypothetical protein
MRRLLCRLELGNSKVELHQRLQSAEPERLSLRHFNHGFSFRRHDAQQASIKAASSSALGEPSSKSNQTRKSNASIILKRKNPTGKLFPNSEISPARNLYKSRATNTHTGFPRALVHRVPYSVGHPTTCRATGYFQGHVRDATQGKALVPGP